MNNKTHRVLYGIGVLISSFFLLPCYARACIGIDVSATDLHFSNYDPLSGTSQQATMDVEVECLIDIALPITFPLGYVLGVESLLSGNTTQKKLQHQSLDFSLDYSIYLDPGLSSVWGAVTSGSTIDGVFESINLSPVHTTTTYGVIFGGQNVPSGHYSDQLVVTIEF